MQGAMDEASSLLREARALAVSLDDPFLLVIADYQLANLWTERAFLLEAGGAGADEARRRARALFEETIRRAHRTPRGRYMVVAAAVDLAVALAQWGRINEAYPLLDLADRTLPRLDDHVPMRGYAALSAAEVALAAGAPRHALARVSAALPLLERASPPGLAQAHRVAALAWSGQGRADKAPAHWTASLGAAARCGQAVEEARTRRAMGG